MAGNNKKKWRDLPPQQRVRVVLLGIVQVTLLAAALRDIARRPASEINGSKRLWRALSLVNFVGPIAYFVFGRKREQQETSS